MLVTYYPPSFGSMLLALYLIPLYPGILLLLIALVQGIRGRPSAKKMAVIGAILLAIGAGLVMWNWDSLSSGNPYHLY